MLKSAITYIDTSEFDNFINKLESASMNDRDIYGDDSTGYSYGTALDDVSKLANELKDHRLEIGKTYYVIMYKDNSKLHPYIQRMELDKIVLSDKMYFCFLHDSDSLVLSNKKSLLSRVFRTMDEAEVVING